MMSSTPKYCLLLTLFAFGISVDVTVLDALYAEDPAGEDGCCTGEKPSGYEDCSPPPTSCISFWNCEISESYRNVQSLPMDCLSKEETNDSGQTCVDRERDCKQADLTATEDALPKIPRHADA